MGLNILLNWFFFKYSLGGTVKFNKQQGFTLIELIMVIVILGILAAVALPKFANLGGDARKASVNALSGNLRSAVAITKSAYIAAGNTTATTVNGVTVAAGTGIPAGSAAGIGAAMENLDGYTADYTTATAVTFRPTGGSATCQAVYNGTTGIVTVDVSSC